MSRIGKQPIAIPQGVEVNLTNTSVEVKGSKGSLARSLPPRVQVKTEEGEIVVTRDGDDREARAMHGLARALINNMVLGVTEGFKKDLEIQGVGYRATLQGKTLNLQLGFSHPILYPFPDGVEIEVEKNIVTIKGIDKEKVGQTAAEIRAYRKPEPYKGKGVRYVGEYVRRKVGKKNV